MYQFSRAIYRELAPDVLEEPLSPQGRSNHERLLRAAEAAVHRLATDRYSFAHPSRALFREIRCLFPMSAQYRALRTVDTYLHLCRDWLDAQPATRFDLLGNPLECRATTRKGSPCRRAPLPVNGYCPSHQHLAEQEDRERFMLSGAH